MIRAVKVNPSPAQPVALANRENPLSMGVLMRFRSIGLPWSMSRSGTFRSAKETMMSHEIAFAVTGFVGFAGASLAHLQEDGEKVKVVSVDDIKEKPVGRPFY
jgi:hypothetical protein